MQVIRRRPHASRSHCRIGGSYRRSSTTTTETADYVIVGAGSAGCVVARRLSEAGNSVLLLESGGKSAVNRWDPRSLLSRMPTALSMPMHFSAFNWAYRTEASPKLQNRRISCPRGKGLGGSSSINGMVYVRGHPMDYQSWEAMGAEGWGWRDVAPYFKKMENWQMRKASSSTSLLSSPWDAQLRGKDGPLHVTAGGNALGTSLYESFIRAGAEAGYGAVEDYNGWRQEGLGPLQRTVFHTDPSSPAQEQRGLRAGERCSTAASYLPTDGSVAVRTHTTALRILWASLDDDQEQDDALATETLSDSNLIDTTTTTTTTTTTIPRAEGIVCSDGRRFVAAKEVILSCGAIGSPTLLQRSGVGDRSLLQQNNISGKVVHSPGVGRNLLDHLEFYFQFGCAGPDSLKPWLSTPRKLLIGAWWLLGEKSARRFPQGLVSAALAALRGLEGFLFGASGQKERSSSSSGAGLADTNHFEAGGFIRSRAGLRYPDVQFHFLPVALSYDGVTSPPTPSGHSFQIHVGTNRSQSRGFVACPGASPLCFDSKIAQQTGRGASERNVGHVPAPTIDFNYMSREEDWADFRRALRLAREIVAQPAFDAQRPVVELLPGDGVDDDAALDSFLSEHLESAYHPCGTCSMTPSRSESGEDWPRVVDESGRVVGTTALRVVDASIFPTIPNGNLNGPTIMVAEKLSDAILGNPPLPPISFHDEGWEGAWWECGEWQTKQRESAPQRPLETCRHEN